MTDRFTDSQMLKLVKIYRDYECLWDVTHPSYKIRETRIDAYNKIAERLCIPGITAKLIPKKIKNLRSSYYQEMKRIEDIPDYKPRVSWFATADAYLRPFLKKQPVFSHVDTPRLFVTVDYKEDNSNSINCESQAQHLEQDENYNAEECPNAAGGAGYEINQIKLEQDEYASSQFMVQPKKPVRNRRTRLKNDDNIYEAIDKLDKIARRVTRTANSLKEHEDESDVFGKYIATTLRTLPEELAIMAKTEMQRVLSEIQLRGLREHFLSPEHAGNSLTSNALDPPNTGPAD